MLYRSTFLAVAAAGAICAPLAALADSVSFTYDGFKGGSASVTVTRDNPTPRTTVNANAGAFDFSGGGMGDFAAWCLDIDTTISTGTYDYVHDDTLLDTDPPYKNPGAKERLEKLFDANYTGTVFGSGANNAGFQLAIWDVIYDDDFDINTGNLTASSGNGAVETAAGTFLSNAENYMGPRLWTITTYDGGAGNDDVQDVGVATAIPLPAAAWLLLGVSGGLVAAKRRQVKKAA